ncbi:MAG: queuosine precursor transporter [Pseudomonadota bacterium]
MTMNSTQAHYTTKTKFFTLFCAIFITLLLTVILTYQKSSLFFHVVIPTNYLILPFTLILIGIITEVYGHEYAKKIISFALLCNLFIILFVKLTVYLPAAPTWHQQIDYQKTLNLNLSQVIFLLATLIVAQFLNAWLITHLKKYPSLAGLPLRHFLSSWASVFFSLVILTVFSPTNTLTVINTLSLYLITSAGYVLIALPITYSLINTLKNYLHRPEVKTPKSSQKMLEPRYYAVLCLAFILTILISNIVTQKITQFHWLIFDIGTLLFPLAYVINCMVSEIYGYQHAKKMIWLSFLTNSLMILLFQLVLLMPEATSFKNQIPYAEVFSMVPRIFVASVLASFFGEFTNAWVLSKLKIILQGDYIKTRMFAATAVGFFIDSTIFSFVAFFLILPFIKVVDVAIWEYILKNCFVLLCLKPTALLISRLKRVEQIDYFDHNANYNPFFTK